MPVALTTQLTLVEAAIVAIQLAPPTDGEIMLVPMASDQGMAARVAVSGDALILGQGRVPGTLIVRGRRDRIAAAALGHGILPLAAIGGCRGNQGTRA